MSTFGPHLDHRKIPSEYPETLGTMKSPSGLGSRFNTEYNPSAMSTMTKPRPAPSEQPYGAAQNCGCKPRTDQDNAYICSVHWNLNQEGHEYLDVDVASRLRSLQAQLETLKGTLQASDSSDKSKNSIYEKIDKRQREYQDDGLGQFMANIMKMKGFYRLSNVCNTNLHCCSRVLWTIILVASLGIAAYQISDRVIYYRSSPQYVNIESKPSAQLVFPAVTICNLNKYRLSKVAGRGLYDAIYSHLHRTTSDAKRSYHLYRNQLSDPYETFSKATRHQVDDMIYRCTWKTTACSSRNFTLTYVNGHACMTFTTDGHDSSVDSAGSHTGLYLVVNAEQYEYILGPTSAVGVRIALHDIQIPPMHFVNIPVGKLTSVQVKKVTRDVVGTYHSPTSTPRDALANVNCRLSCREKIVERTCQCYLPYFQNKPSTSQPCSTYMYFTCARAIMDESTSTCGCDNKPVYSGYDVTLSYAAMPKYALESEVRTLKHRSQLERRFRESMDVFHRYDKAVFRHDSSTLSATSQYLAQCATSTDEMLKSAKIYEIEYTRIISDTLALFNKKKHTVRLHQKYYRQANHLAFADYISYINDFLVQIIGFETMVMSSRDLKSINSTMTTITWNIRQTVSVGDDAPSSVTPMLDEIKNIVVDFRNKMQEYGSHYATFRQQRESYDESIASVLQCVEAIGNVLTNEYHRIRAVVTDTDRDWVSKQADTLPIFFAEIKNLVSGKLTDLTAEGRALHKKYNADRSKIINVLDKFNATAQEFSVKIQSFNIYLNTINSSLPEIRGKIARMQTKTLAIADGYIKGKIGKFELATKLTSQDFTDEQRHITASLEDLSRVVLAMNENSATLTDFLETSIFSDVNKPSRSENLQSTKLVTKVNALVKLISTTMTSVDRYQNELVEYRTATKVNENFYMNNFLNIDVYFKQMSETFHTEHWSYTIFDLSCDIGCTLALYLGASILSLFQLIDFLSNCCMYTKRKSNSESPY